MKVRLNTEYNNQS